MNFVLWLEDVLGLVIDLVQKAIALVKGVDADALAKDFE